MINYPTKKKSAVQSISSTSNQRGMNLEKDLNDSNTFYKETGRALIYKKPTPVQIVRVDYPKRTAAKIVEAYYKTPSTTDYNGIYRSTYIDFEAKETTSKTSFAFRNIHEHQIAHLRAVKQHGGIAFLVIRFIAYNETYLLDAEYIINEEKQHKSISYKKVQTHGYLIDESYTPRLKYLDVVDAVYFKEDSYGK
ncbi:MULTISPECIES: Holliday junction resolvase RecU [unclassified Breznakia]|uniref:Holliday junction resolvase RecU n=1 Tax=unclassified Breznakia TaxID=2623764 RepID=UPI0024756257|nr:MULTISPECIES: Holliday junction resolvase RecU [unclassified Breznakia]MDH6367217.1 recombination protein U [Breznakia sp. PH1-1]MDH6404363.1 recombination protein U [Breznakia sp. PF1-11]MDH6412072.1 recombination protein U [Breznakia sp. PFB1-11]MDH6414351.1 recombination protein U [Breznakia sp. PFB1-14]MDH6416719.1 recombination protein U [Breznakia sp. PFB1-4]